MHLKHLALGLAVAIAPVAVTAAQAEDGIYIPLFSYRTGPFATSGIPIANGMADYLNMLNERDGGIGGAKLIVEECETGYDTKKGVECYEIGEEQTPRSHQPLFDRNNAATDPQGGSRQDSNSLDGLRPLRVGRRQRLSVDIQPAGDLLGRRLGLCAPCRRQSKAVSTSLKGKKFGLIHLDAPLRQRADPAVAGIGRRLRLRAETLSGSRR